MSDGQLFGDTQYYHGAPAPSVLHSFRAPSNVEVEETEKGSHILKGVVIFRAGVFRDNRGIERTWTADQLAAMAANFDMLRDNKVFMDVPIRADYTIFVRDVVGYFSKVYVDPTDPNFLLADIEITEPEAFGKWQRGTYRSRSLEIGPYLANGSETPVWPTVLGMAFVDVPAVEGLHRQAPPSHFSQFIEDGAPDPTNKDVNMDPKALAHLAAWLQAPGNTADGWIAACNHAKSVEDSANHSRQQEQERQNFQAACNYAAAVEMHKQNAASLGLPTDYAQAYQFRINGQVVTDPAAAQRVIDAQAEAIQTAAKTERQDFVKQLVKDNKLAAPMEVSTQALVDTFTTEQFAAYRQTMEATPALQVFGAHGAPGHQGGTGTGNPDVPGQPSEKDTLAETVQQFRYMGKDDTFIKGTTAYQRLIALDPTATIA